MTKPDGGPAFPIFADSVPKGGNAAWGGMSMRDYFAAAALTGILASDSEIGPASATATAWNMADRMLAEREEVWK